MRGIRVFKVLAVVLLLLLLGPAPVSAVIFPEVEKTTATLIGEDGKGNFTIFLKQTQTGTNDLVFIMDLAVQSNFDFRGCHEDSIVFEDDPFAFCERDLWVAVLLPDRRLFFLQLLRGFSLSIQDAGSLDTLPDLPGVQPYLRLGGLFVPSDIAVDPYPSRGRLFGLPQTVVNALPPGRYSIFAGYTTRVTRATDLFDLFAKAVSNVDQ